MAKHRFTTDEFRIIEWHNGQLLASAKREIARLQEIPKRNRPVWLQNQLHYWKHVAGALVWSTEIARQRMGKQSNVKRSTV